MGTVPPSAEFTLLYKTPATARQVNGLRHGNAARPDLARGAHGEELGRATGTPAAAVRALGTRPRRQAGSSRRSPAAAARAEGRRGAGGRDPQQRRPRPIPTARTGARPAAPSAASLTARPRHGPAARLTSLASAGGGPPALPRAPLTMSPAAQKLISAPPGGKRLPGARLRSSQRRLPPAPGPHRTGLRVAAPRRRRRGRAGPRGGAAAARPPGSSEAEPCGLQDRRRLRRKMMREIIVWVF